MVGHITLSLDKNSRLVQIVGHITLSLDKNSRLVRPSYRSSQYSRARDILLHTQIRSHTYTQRYELGSTYVYCTPE